MWFNVQLKELQAKVLYTCRYILQCSLQQCTPTACSLLPIRYREGLVELLFFFTNRSTFPSPNQIFSRWPLLLTYLLRMLPYLSLAVSEIGADLPVFVFPLSSKILLAPPLDLSKLITHNRGRSWQLGKRRSIVHLGQ